MRGAGKTGGFCTTFGKQNAPKTDTRRMRTRVYPVILDGHPVILGPKKSLSQLRILKKKFEAKKMPRLARHKSFFRTPGGTHQGKFLGHVHFLVEFVHDIFDMFKKPSFLSMMFSPL